MPQAQVLGRGSSGIATLATVLADKNADCHTPPAVLVRGGSTMQRMGVVSRAAVCALFGRSVAPLPSSLQVYYTTKGTICQ